MFERKIIWPVNVIDSPELQKNALFVLGALSRATRAEIQPVSIVHAPQRPQSVATNNLADAFVALAEKRMAEIVAKSDIEGMSSGRVLLSPSDSAQNQVRLLFEYAEREKAGAIVVSTHARSGISRFFLGSFAETLILSAKIPVFTVNPQAMVRERIGHILLPTTFAPQFRPVFEQVVELAKSVEAKLTLFYKEPLIPSPFMTPEIYEYIDKETVERKKDALSWQSWATKTGVPTEVRVDPQPGYVPQAIEAYASVHNVDLIAMASRATGWSSLVAGSTARQVVREAQCPVWIVHVDED